MSRKSKWIYSSDYFCDSEVLSKKAENNVYSADFETVLVLIPGQLVLISGQSMLSLNLGQKVIILLD